MISLLANHSIKFFVIVAAAIMHISCSEWVNSDWGDCGYSAYYELKNDGKRPELIFSDILDETVSGHRNCGYKFIKTRVDKPEINGTILPERVESDAYGQTTYYYEVPAGFDPKTMVITIQVSGTTYRSDLSSVKETDDRVDLRLKASSIW
ncbi:MAG: hypothetical protein IPM25_20350 [Chloracidobacterium sp.]|nr:hypothetical protein [Chloracidobacterium sp.]